MITRSFCSFMLLLFVFKCSNINAQNNLSETPILSPWELANPFGISVGQPADKRWEAGRVNDIVEVDGSTILTASDNAGVWMLRRGGSIAVSFSKNWEYPDVQTLAKYRIPGGNRVIYFAGGSTSFGNGSLYHTNPASAAPLLENWMNFSLSSRGIGDVNKILVLQNLNKIILATTNGIWYSNIPAVDNPNGYNFAQVMQFDNFSRPFYDLTETTDNKIIATIKWRNETRTSSGIYYGSFTNDILSFTPSTVTGLSASERQVQGTTSVSSCSNSKNVVYAISARISTGVPLALFKSTDAGLNFTRIPIMISNTPNPQFGIQGDGRTNCIDVSPVNPDVVVFGWVTGPYISSNGGTSFLEIYRWSSHDDKACIVFSNTDNNRFYLGSDGGATSFNSLTASNNYAIDYSWNMRLPTLQFVGPSFLRSWWGRMDALPLVSSRIGGGLQDNGVVLTENNGAWKHIEPGFDGGTVYFPACGGILWSNAGRGIRYRRGTNGDAEIPIRVFAPGADRSNDTLNGIFALVNSTSSRRRNSRGQNMFAIATNSADTVNGTRDVNNMYGIFANADGTDMNAEFLYRINTTQEPISAISSNDQFEIFVAKEGTGKVFKLIWNGVRQIYDQSESTGMANSQGTAVVLIDVPTSSEAFALRNDNFRRGEVYYSANGTDWRNITTTLPSATFYSMDLFKNACKEVLFVTTDKAVYATTDRGGTWTNVSYGLPVTPHTSDIHVIQSLSCSSEVYLSTYGWSVWKAKIK